MAIFPLKRTKGGWGRGTDDERAHGYNRVYTHIVLEIFSPQNFLGIGGG